MAAIGKLAKSIASCIQRGLIGWLAGHKMNTAAISIGCKMSFNRLIVTSSAIAARKGWPMSVMPNANKAVGAAAPASIVKKCSGKNKHIGDS